MLLVNAAASAMDFSPNGRKCWYQLAQENLLAERLRAPAVTTSNIQTLFAHHHSPGHFGAKAVAYRDSTGEIRQVFFPIREGDRALNHTLALGMFLLMDAEKMEERVRLLEDEMVALTDKKRRMKEAGATYEATKALSLQCLDLAEQGSRLNDRIRTFRQLASSVASLRERTPFNYIDPNDVQGFEFTAVQKAQGEWVITTFEVDSIITEHQRVHANHSVTPIVSGQKMAELVLSVHGKIDSGIRRYSDVYLNSLSDVPFSDSNTFFSVLEGTGLNGRP